VSQSPLGAPVLDVRAVDVRAVLAALADVADPEIPSISIVDLGLVHRVEVTPNRITVELLPTFVGCPALDVIRSSVEGRLATFDRPVKAAFTFSVPWSSDRISARGREHLRASGFAPPGKTPPLTLLPLATIDDAVECPNCGSHRTVMENAFGPTQCRAIHYCTSCRQPFEAFKPI
jgi:ring-1,2-phenylacetyl-CoA epoxidase subunit PaaD